MSIKAKEINESINWHDITPGASIFEGGTSSTVNTGDWRTNIPTFIAEKCKQCLLCVPACPDMAIPVNAQSKREDFNFFYCKGCGICYKVCPFGAITFGKEEK